ncbi:MAG: DNA-3-methyladenine glycosylase [Bacteroidales bacterium]|nr:DNA-3-methyladenine glycosylase [Bacteroidales bacterium]
MFPGKRLSKEFFIRDVLDVAPELIGKNIVIRLPGGTFGRFQVTEVEAYRGAEDNACHACKGRTPRTEIMFHEGGRLYVYLVYGMYWMLNVVTGEENIPQAVLIRGVENYSGPGRITKSFGIDRTFYGENLDISERIWFEDAGVIPVLKTGTRIGIDYAGEYWKTRPWRYYLQDT